MIPSRDKEPMTHHDGGQSSAAVNTPSQFPLDEVALAKMRLRQLSDDQSSLYRLKPPVSSWWMGGGAIVAGLFVMKLPVLRAAIKLGVLLGIRQAVARYLKRAMRG